MNSENESVNTAAEKSQSVDRREALRRAGKLAAYAAPFTVLALTNKAEAATGHGPGKQVRH
jgi:hypothetical protein